MKVIAYNNTILDPCTCKNLIDANGFGNCQATQSVSTYYAASVGCYVNQPSGCQDLTASTTHPGEQSSTDACLFAESN